MQNIPRCIVIVVARYILLPDVLAWIKVPSASTGIMPKGSLTMVEKDTRRGAAPCPRPRERKRREEKGGFGLSAVNYCTAVLDAH